MSRHAAAGLGLLATMTAVTTAYGQDQPGILSWPAPAATCVPPARYMPYALPPNAWPEPSPEGPGVVTQERVIWQLLAQTAELTERVEALSRNYDVLARELQARRVREEERAERERLRRQNAKARGAYYPRGD